MTSSMVRSNTAGRPDPAPEPDCDIERPAPVPDLPTDPPPTPAPVAALWREAGRRGWLVTRDATGTAWSVSPADRSASAGYAPPGEICTGVVSGYNPAETLTRTGVDTAESAVAHIRTFLGWPATPDDDVPDAPQMDEFATIAPGGAQ